MKHFSSVFFTFILLAVSCSTLPQNPKGQETEFKISPSTFAFDCNGGTQSLTVSAPGQWTLSSTEDWCKLSVTSGSGNQTVDVTVEENLGNISERSARILFDYNGFTMPVSITQSGDPAGISIDPTSIELGAKEQDFSITVISPTLEYEITIVDEWISEVSRSGEPATGETIVFHALANNSSDEPRCGVISVCTKDGNCIPVMISQEGEAVRGILAMRFTAIWCGYCPYMDESFHLAAQKDERFVFVTFHASAGYPLYFNGSNTLANAYDIDGYPSGILGGWKAIANTTNTETAATNIVKSLDTFESTFPETVGLSVSAEFNGNMMLIHADVSSDETQDLKAVALVVESGIVEPQTYYPVSGGSTEIDEFVHDNVARKLASSSILGESFSVTAGETTGLDWSCPYDSKWVKDNLSVAVWISKDYGDEASKKLVSKYPDYYITNARIVPVQQ